MTTASILSYDAHNEPEVRQQLRPIVITVFAAKLMVAVLLLAAVNLSSPVVAEPQQTMASISDF